MNKKNQKDAMRQNAIRVATEEHEAMLDEIHRRKVLEHEEDAEDASSEEEEDSIDDADEEEEEA